MTGAAHYEDSTCPSCGHAWFELAAHEPDGPTGVTLDERGMPTGYAGRWVCQECKEPWRPPAERRRRFTVVDGGGEG